MRVICRPQCGVLALALAVMQLASLEVTAKAIIPVDQCPMLNNKTAAALAAKAKWDFAMQPNYGHLVRV
jgi:hypothetical protein